MAYPLQVIEVFLRNLDGPLPIQAVRGHALNGLFYSRLGHLDSALVRSLHMSNDPAPFSLSPIYNAERGEFHGFRVGLLSDEISDLVEAVWTELWKSGEEIRLGSARMRVQDLRIPNYPRPTDYAGLLAEAPVAHGVWLEFDMPARLTVFSQSDLLPTPVAVWRFYLHKWQAFSGGVELPPQFLRWVENEVRVTELDLETRIALLEKDLEWKGVMGRVEYQAKTDGEDVPPGRIADYLRAWQALAFLAEFCGTGEKTTMGMGRTRRVKVFGRHSDRR